MARGRQELRVVISGDASQLKRAFAQAELAGGKFERGMSGAMSRVGTAMRHLSVGAVAGAGFGIMSLVKAGAEYEKEMARVKAVTGATGTQFKSLGDLAKQLGKDTKFSAGEAAQAMYELGSAGFKAGEMSKVLPGTLSLAAASSVSLADAAEISSNALRGFGLQSSKSGHVADVLAQAVASSSVEMQDLQYTLKYIGPVARLTGQSFEDMIAAVELMGNAGIKGEQAGTSLRGALVRLTKPTKMVQEALRDVGLSASDLNGPKGLKPLPDLIRLLASHTDKMSKSARNHALAQIFGTEALSGMSVVVSQGADRLEALSKANAQSEGAAKRMADTMNNTVAGAFENFKGSVETAGITLFEKFQKPLRQGLLGAARLLNNFPAMVKGRMDMAKLLPVPSSRTNVIAQMLGDAVANVPWGAIGQTIATGISKGIQFSGTFAHAVETGIGAALSHVDGKKLLSGLLRVVAQAIDALFSPSFWRENFANIFATVTIAIPVARILKIPGARFLFDHISKPFFKAIAMVGKALLSLFGRVGGAAIRELVGELRSAPGVGGAIVRIATNAGKALLSIPRVFRRNAQLAVSWLVSSLIDGAAKVGGAVGRLIAKGLNKLASFAPNFLKGGAKLAGELVRGLIHGLTGLPGKIGSSLKSAASHIPLIGKAFKDKGDGIGKASAAVSPLGLGIPHGKGSAALKGARSTLAPFAAVGARFGLSVSSGKRPGSITSSGNVSYHSTGEAIDEAGSASGMLRYFRYMKSHFGGRLAELIHTPGGVGIKDGRPYTYGGQVAADHFDHVHVALDTGRPGVGDGLGRFVATSYGPPWGGIQGTGVTASGVNLKGNPHIYGVAADPRVLPLGSRVKITPNPFGYRGDFRVFDTGGAIKGKRIDFYDWRGRGAQLAWGSKSVTVSTTSGASSSRSGGSRADAPSPTDLREKAEKEGSRIVSRIAAPFMRGKTGITALKRFAALGEQTISDKNTEYGQAERRFGLSDEDLGTPAGRTKRLSELKELAKLKNAQLQREQAELRAIVAAIKKYDGLIKKLRAQVKKARGATAARIRKRIKDYDDARIELAAQARALGAAIEDTKLDIGDLFKEGATVAATEDTAVEAGPTVTDRVSDLVSLVDLKERAGLISAATAQQQRADIISAGIQGKFGATTEREQLQLMGDLRDVQQAGVQAVEDNTSAIRELQKSIDDNTAFAKSVMATENASLVSSIADLISGQIAGVGIAGRGLMPGTAGVRARY